MRKIIALIIWGLILTAFAIPAAQRQRGYFAIGGEYLLLLAPALIDELYQTVKGAADIKEEPQD